MGIALRRGDRRVFRALVDQHQERLYAFALRMMGNEDAALELVQDVFVAAWKGAKNFRGDCAASTWLHGIAVRRARHQWRSSARRERREEAWASEQYATAVRRSMPEAHIELERALQRLPPRMRAVVVLHCIEGRPQREVGAMLGIAEGTVKAHVHKARTILRRHLTT